MSPSDQMGADLKAARKTIRELVEALSELRSACHQRDFALTTDSRLKAADRYTEALIDARQAISNAEGKT